MYNKIEKTNIFQKVDAIFLITEMNDNDQALQTISNEIYANNPKLFDGDSIYLYYKMKYVPPYEKFNELRHLILKIKNSTGLRYEFKGIIAIDLFEFINHEDDEYFEIILKFLYDHKHIWHYIFTFQNAGVEKIKPIFEKTIHFFKTAIIDRCLFNHKDELNTYLKTTFDYYNAKYNNSAIDMLTDIFFDKKTKNIKSYEKINMIVRDIIENSPNMSITAQTLIRNINEEKLILNMFIDKKILMEVERNDKKLL